MTVTRAPKTPPTPEQFERWILNEQANDTASANPLGRAMRRVVAYPGNTLLEIGKFELRPDQLSHVIRRTTKLALGGDARGTCAEDKDTYIIPSEKFRSMMPPAQPGYDSWWLRIYELLSAYNDRAFWAAREQMDRLGIAMPLIDWMPREDVLKHVKLHRQIPDNAEDDTCMICGSQYLVDGEYPCEMPCGHLICLECVTLLVDQASRKGLAHGEEDKDPGCMFWRCPNCREIIKNEINRADIIEPSELHFWRHFLCMKKLELMATKEWDGLTAFSEEERYLPPYSEMPGIAQNNARTTVRLHDAVEFMEKVPIFVAGLLNWGHCYDNPAVFTESGLLKNHLIKELRRLERTQQAFILGELVEHLTQVGWQAFKPIVALNESDRLGNPIYPPGYEAYLKFLCEWTARGCFLGPLTRHQFMDFFRDMQDHQNEVWWKGRRLFDDVGT